VAVPGSEPRLEPAKGRSIPDTIIVPAEREGFERVFIGENSWHAIRSAGAMLDKSKYCGVYQVQPISAVTHVAPVRQIEPFGESGRYRLVFAEPATKIAPIPFGDATMGTMQGPRYTTYDKLKSAKKVTDLF
jgi:hypothetical protein